MQIWFTILASWPAPTSPSSLLLAAYAEITGSNAAEGDETELELVGSS